MPYCPSLDRIKRIPLSMGVSSNDADDLAQQSFVACLEYVQRKHCLPRAALEGTITRRRCSDYFRKSAANHRLSAANDDIAAITDPFPSPAEEVEEWDTIRFVRKVIATTLSRRYSEVLRLAYWEELSDAQIASRLGLTQECVRQRKKRGRDMLKPVLEHGLAIC